MGKGFLASALGALLLLGAARSSRRPPSRELAITFDDLPGVSIVGGGPRVSPSAQDDALRRMTERLLATLVRARVPVVGFVNSRKLERDGAPVPARIAILTRWRDAGFELGNHTAGHLDLHRVPLEEFEADVVRGESAVRSILEERGDRLRWFRHPFLHTGRSLEDKTALEEFLARRGYRIAPVTIDNSEWIFARAYANARDRGDPGLARRIEAEYGLYMEAQFDYLERQSAVFFGREIRQVLLVHANSLNADAFAPLLSLLARRGYSFVTLDRALEDPAYKTADTFDGPGGITWIHRWVLSAGRTVLPGEPTPAAFVSAAAGVAD
jgi:peptidoglycan/xylan/chitin deacetylase (PgdA/CDA1 family)